MKLGSLFDGSGTCPLAASAVGITPVWASEIEPFPVAVTTSRFPSMKHLGDITKINGAKIEPVDVITFGSPCQNLSMAGNRKGLDGEQSVLFLEAVRIITEMRLATNGRYPQIAMWENVFGAFSSNGGGRLPQSPPRTLPNLRTRHVNSSISEMEQSRMHRGRHVQPRMENPGCTGLGSSPASP